MADSRRKRTRRRRETGRAPRTSGVAKPEAAEELPEFQPPPNDNISALFTAAGIVPPQYRGTDRFLDVVTWNIRFFHDRDRDRVKRIVNVLTELNADVIVLQEIRDQSLEVVAEELRRNEAGYYSTAYGTTGGEQRVAMMWDLDWVRAKDDVTELFGRGVVRASDGKDAFPRLPLYSSFTCLTDRDPFDFQLVGLHLKSQRGGGGEQRTRAARELRNWLFSDASLVDADVIMLGDWNEPPGSDTWDPIHQMEEAGELKFRSINSESAISHLMYRNKREFGTRLDLAAVSMAASAKMKKPPESVKWISLEELLAGDPSARQIRDYIAAVREDVSDHLPVVSRFYFTDRRR